MKNFQKSYLILTLLIIAIFTFYGFMEKETNDANGGILVMRTLETYNGIIDNSITIVDENGNQEIIELDRLRRANHSKNVVTIAKQLNLLQSKGYQLLSSSSGVSEGKLVTTYVFSKE